MAVRKRPHSSGNVRISSFWACRFLKCSERVSSHHGKYSHLPANICCSPLHHPCQHKAGLLLWGARLGEKICLTTKPGNTQINRLRCSQNYGQVPPRTEDFSSRGFCMLRRWGFNVIHPTSHSFLTEPVPCARTATTTPRAFLRGACLMWYRRHLSSDAAGPGFPLHSLPSLPN